jgi:hypothetical protein
LYETALPDPETLFVRDKIYMRQRKETAKWWRRMIRKHVFIPKTFRKLPLHKTDFLLVNFILISWAT